MPSMRDEIWAMVESVRELDQLFRDQDGMYLVDMDMQDREDALKKVEDAFRKAVLKAVRLDRIEGLEGGGPG